MIVTTKSIKKHLLTIALIIIIILCIIFGSMHFSKLLTDNEKLSDKLIASDTEVLKAKKEKRDLVNALNETAKKSDSFAGELNKVTQDLNQLEWLSSLDPQLLQKYSKVYFLNENYIPKHVVPIDSKFLFNKTKSVEIDDFTLPFLRNMLNAAQDENVQIQIASGYRSFGTQSTLKSAYRAQYGSGANSFSADQGYSEHQLGTTVDMTTSKIGGGLTGFEKTPAYEWLKENAYKYGFILSYPPNNTYYVYEPWHWRFVGLDLALKLHQDNKNFYDLDQRDINSYLGKIFNTSVGS
jgi:LAS superfamily LD-carboxypeptidase LdcB